MPIHKKNSVFLAGNYRGVHLTAQVSKAMERLLRTRFMPFLLKSVAYGPNQFAYTPERGARDALALLLLVWIKEIANKKIPNEMINSLTYISSCLPALAAQMR